ncbi:TonB-dependent receptor [Flavobacteriales bacterium]|nr:TonB-dependent receptor [Flavobacteriales bacterium]MDC1352741.1 TonB-dependent receptor [Flavobacteriales bacterium]
MREFLLFFFLVLSFGGFAQQGTGQLKGSIANAKTGELIPYTYLTISQNDEIKSSATTDSEGRYLLNGIEPGEYSLKVKAIGYKDFERKWLIRSNHITFFDFKLIPLDIELNEFIVVEKRYNQKIEDETVSTTILDKELIQEKITANIVDAVTQIPGVHTQEGQVSIRGGAGFSYGAGSRVLLMVDGIPMLSGDAGDIKWNYLPVENVNQIEVLKGASSVLYGSSALNGVINIQTEYPTIEPKTSINLFSGMYDSPFNSRDLKWWDGYRGNQGLSFYHARQVSDNFDLVIGGNFFNDQSFRMQESEERGKLNINTRFLSKKTQGLYYGVNVNGQLTNVDLFFVWKHKDSVLTPSPGTEGISKNNRYNITPYVEYFTKKGDKHSLKTQLFNTTNNNQLQPNQSSVSNLFYSDYRFRKNIDSSFTITSGATYIKTYVRSGLFGNHQSSNIAVYSQLDKTVLKKLKLSGGIRLESFEMDGEREKLRPIFRTGFNYKLGKATFLRGSFGQGYRFASIAERYASTNLGSLRVFPNPELQSESGVSGEWGIKQGFKIKDWKGFIDISRFVNEYNNMNEYTFGFFDTTTFQQKQSGTITEFGASSRNVDKAVIKGIDVTVVAKGYTKRFGITLLGGYTFMNPKPINPDSAYLNTFSSLTTNYTYDRSLNLASDTVSDNLKYRFNHLLKFDIQIDYRNLSVGVSYRYNSFVHNIDESFSILGIFSGETFLGELDSYRRTQRKGNTIIDLRTSYQLTEAIRITGTVNNLLNLEYQTRPGWVMPPRNYNLRVNFTF